MGVGIRKCWLQLSRVFPPPVGGSLVTRPRFDSEKGALFSVSRKMAAIRGRSCEFKGRFWDRKSTSLLWHFFGELFELVFVGFSKLAFLHVAFYTTIFIQQTVKRKIALTALRSATNTGKHQKTTVSKVLKLINTLKREKKRYLQLNISNCIQTLMVRVCIVYLVACGMLIDWRVNHPQPKIFAWEPTRTD